MPSLDDSGPPQPPDAEPVGWNTSPGSLIRKSRILRGKLTESAENA
jgi:hypothetical protein